MAGGSDLGRLRTLTKNRSYFDVDAAVKALGWNRSKLERVVGGSHGWFSFAGRGSNRRLVSYGTEGGGVGRVAVYNETIGHLNGSWGDERFKAMLAVDVSRGGPRCGPLQRPDLFAVAYPKRGFTTMSRPHAHFFEVEAAGKFSLNSIYQAHSQGRFADFSWVAFVRDGRSTKKQPWIEERPADVNGLSLRQLSEKTWDHMLWVGRQLGVGIISYADPSHRSSWEVHLEAQQRSQPSPRRLLDDVLPSDVHGLFELDGPEQATQDWVTSKRSDAKPVQAKRFGIRDPLD